MPEVGELNKEDYELLLQEATKRVQAYNVLSGLMHKYQLTKVRKMNRFLGTKNGKDLLSGDLTHIDQNDLIRYTGKIISHVFLYGTVDD